jgi:hypothetical protein
VSRVPAAPRPWVLAAPGLDPGSKLCLIALHGYGPHWKSDDPDPTEPIRVWPLRTTLASALGVSVDTVKGWLRRLTQAGWIRRVGHAWELAIGVPWAATDMIDPGASTPSPGAVEPSPGASTPGRQRTRTGRAETLPGRHDTRTRAPARPQKNQEEPVEEPRKEPKADARADSAIDAVLDERHRAIAAEQARLAERDRVRAEVAATASLDAATISAVRAVGPRWAVELERSTWAEHLAKAVADLGLTPEAVGAVLAAWDVAAAKLAAETGTTPELATARLAKFDGPMPRRDAVWWLPWRGWVAEQLAPSPKLEAGSARSSTPLGCRPADGTPEVITFDPEAARRRIAARREREQEAARQGAR